MIRTVAPTAAVSKPILDLVVRPFTIRPYPSRPAESLLGMVIVTPTSQEPGDCGSCDDNVIAVLPSGFAPLRAGRVPCAVSIITVDTSLLRHEFLCVVGLFCPEVWHSGTSATCPRFVCKVAAESLDTERRAERPHPICRAAGPPVGDPATRSDLLNIDQVLRPQTPHRWSTVRVSGHLQNPRMTYRRCRPTR